MDISYGDTADATLAPAPVDGRVTVVRIEAVQADFDENPGGAAVAADTVVAEFWDACWTLEDEWLPRATGRPEPQPHHGSVQAPPEVFVLL